MKKRLFALILCLCLMAGFLPAAASAAPQDHILRCSPVYPPSDTYTYEGKYSIVYRAPGDVEYFRPRLPSGEIVETALTADDPGVVTLELYDSAEHIWKMTFRSTDPTAVKATVDGTDYSLLVNQPGPQAENALVVDVVFLPNTDWFSTRIYSGFSISPEEPRLMQFFCDDVPVTAGLIYDSSKLTLEPQNAGGLRGVYLVTLKEYVEEDLAIGYLPSGAAEPCEVEVFPVHAVRHFLSARRVYPPTSGYTFEGPFTGMGGEINSVMYIRPLQQDGTVVAEALTVEDPSAVALELYDSAEHIWKMTFLSNNPTEVTATVNGNVYTFSVNPSGPQPENPLLCEYVLLPNPDWFFGLQYSGVSLAWGVSNLWQFLCDGMPVTDDLIYDSSKLTLKPKSAGDLRGVYAVTMATGVRDNVTVGYLPAGASAPCEVNFFPGRSVEPEIGFYISEEPDARPLERSISWSDVPDSNPNLHVENQPHLLLLGFSSREQAEKVNVYRVDSDTELQLLPTDSFSGTPHGCGLVVKLPDPGEGRYAVTAVPQPDQPDIPNISIVIEGEATPEPEPAPRPSPRPAPWFPPESEPEPEPEKPATFPPVVGEAQNGMITVSPEAPAEGDAVTVAVQSEDGFELSRLTALGPDGNEIALTENADGTFSFIQPAGTVTITADFAEIEVRPELPFVDCSEEDWFYEAVSFCYDSGYFKGVDETHFNAGDTMDRKSFAVVLYRIAGEPGIAAEDLFTDVRSDAWFADAVNWASENGIIEGYGNGVFGANDPITREQIITLFWRFCGRPAADGAVLHAFSDAGQISDWAKDALAWAVSTGLVKGEGNDLLAPGVTATRGEIAQLVMNYCKLSENP